MRVLLFSDFQLPDSCANAVRVINFAKMLKELNCEIDVMGVDYSGVCSLSGTIDGIEYSMLSAKTYTGIHAYRRIKYIKADIKRMLVDKFDNVAYDAILLSNIYYDYSDIFLNYSKKHGTKLIVNAVEWYEKNNNLFSGMFGKIKFVKNRIALRYIHKKMGNIIAISSLLEEYYKKRGCNTTTIPTIVDMKEYESVLTKTRDISDRIHIAYAGDPGRKDYVLNAIYALGLLSDDERRKIHLDFYGITYDKLYTLGVTKEFVQIYKECITCHGRIPYERVKEKIHQADFTILLRPNKRYANAGFPTKVGESMACGTPVIANITSDLGKYIVDGKTGIVCENETTEACAEAFRRVARQADFSKHQMREQATKVAETEFSYYSYLDTMDNFLKSCK